MADTLEKGMLFNPDLLSEMYSTVKGTSAIAALCGQTPISFVGNDVMVFSMDDEIALVGESEAKEAGAMDVAPVTIKPVKIEYGHRVTREFKYASDEKQLDLLGDFTDGFGKKVARGLDIMGFHAMNPRTKQVSSEITHSFTDVTNSVAYDASAPDDSLQSAIGLLGDYDCTGMALSKTFAADMAKIKTNNTLVYPEFAFGAQATSFYGTPCAVNTTVDYDDATMAIVGDFANAFKWGVSQEIPLEIIEYGDPDNTGDDLAGHNQIYLRAEVWIGLAVLDPNAFCKIAGAAPTSVKTTSAKASK